MNEVQKNFKNQMNQSLKELKKKDKDAYHEYMKWNHLDDSRSRLKRETHQKAISILSSPFRILLKLIGIGMIIAMGYNFVIGINRKTQSSSFNMVTPATYTQSQTRSTNQKQIINYMNFINPIINSINQDINLRNKNLKNFNNKLVTKSEYISDNTVYINRTSNSIAQIASFNCPIVLETYKNILLNQYSSLIKAMNNEIGYLNSGNSSLKNEVTQNIEEYKSKNQDAQGELNNILKENKLK